MIGGHARFIGQEVEGAEQVRSAVRAQIAAGAAVIKVIASGGVLTPGTDHPLEFLGVRCNRLLARLGLSCAFVHFDRLIHEGCLVIATAQYGVIQTDVLALVFVDPGVA